MNPNGIDEVTGAGATPPNPNAAFAETAGTVTVAIGVAGNAGKAEVAAMVAAAFDPGADGARVDMVPGAAGKAETAAAAVATAVGCITEVVLGAKGAAVEPNEKTLLALDPNEKTLLALEPNENAVADDAGIEKSVEGAAAGADDAVGLRGINELELENEVTVVDGAPTGDEKENAGAAMVPGGPNCGNGATLMLETLLCSELTTLVKGAAKPLPPRPSEGKPLLATGGTT